MNFKLKLLKFYFQQQKDSKKSILSDSSSNKLSAYDKDDSKRDSSPLGRSLSTIDEEKLKLKNKFLRNNKLVPLDDRADYDNRPVRSTESKSWAITDYSSSSTRPRRFED